MERIAVFAGSFDPFTIAHFSITKKASALFDRVIVAVGKNVQKHPLFTVDARIRLIQKAVAELSNVNVDSFTGLTVDFLKKSGAKYLVRGVHSSSEFDVERNLALNNRMLYPEVETIILFVEPEYAAVSSSAVREILNFGGDVSKMVPDSILKDIFNE